MLTTLKIADSGKFENSNAANFSLDGEPVLLDFPVYPASRPIFVILPQSLFRCPSSDRWQKKMSTYNLVA